MKERVYTKGVYDFEKIVRSGAVISDKTDLIYDMVHDNEYVFLSRPRRFGKSLLCSQLKFYFQGRKELFANFKIADLEQDWTEYPVFSFSMSSTKEQGPEGIRQDLFNSLDFYEDTYGTKESEITPGQKLKGLIHRAYKQTGRHVVIIIDEYDAPLLAKVRSEEEMAAVRSVLLDFYQQIKECDRYIRFAFLTGITRFSNLSIFSSLNNLNDVSMLPQYATICGITQSELETVFKPDVEILAEAQGMSYDAMLAVLKKHYDGYHFCKNQTEEIYNPYSLTLAFQNQRIDNYWFASGTPSYLIPNLRRFKTDIAALGDMHVSSSQFDVSIDSQRSALPLLYQTGYLTIKGYDNDSGLYRLDFPNAEVKVGFMDCVVSELLELENTDTQGLEGRFYVALRDHRVDDAMQHLRAYFAGLGYPSLCNSKLKDPAWFESFYQTLFAAVFGVFNCRIRTEVRSMLGRADVVFRMPDATYVAELKICASKASAARTAAAALKQIGANGYAVPYQQPGQRVVKIGIAFARNTRTVESWKVEE